MLEKRFKLPPIPLLLIISAFLLLRLLYLDFVYIWDGGYIYYDILSTVRHSFNIFNFNMVGHPSFIYILFLSLSQYLDPGNNYLLNLQLLFLDILAVFAFYKILLALFPDKKFRLEIYLVTLILAFHPVLLGNSINLNLDHGVFVISVLLFYCLIYKHLIQALICGTFLTFTKESGVSAYFFITILYMIFLRKKYLNITDFFATQFKHWYLFLPAVLFLSYAMVFGLVLKQTVLF